MKVGDLVELSASGRKTQYCWEARDKVGLIVGQREPTYSWGQAQTEYKVAWLGMRPDHFNNRYTSSTGYGGWWRRGVFKFAKRKKHEDR